MHISWQYAKTNGISTKCTIQDQNKKKLIFQNGLKKIGLTCSLVNETAPDTLFDPVNVKFKDVHDKDTDIEALKHKTQMHSCNGYCLKLSLSTDEDRKK